MNPIKDNRLVNKGKNYPQAFNKKVKFHQVGPTNLAKPPPFQSKCSITCISYATCNLGIIAYGNKLNHAIFKERERMGLLNSANTC